MKKILYAISMMALLLCACSKDEQVPKDKVTDEDFYPIENTLKFEAKELVFTPQKTSGSIHINTNIEYIVELEGENKDWIKYDANSNKYISFEVRPNNSENERSAKCIISNKDLKLSDTLLIKQSINKERLALISIYKALNGDQWINNENWCSDKPLNEWEGVMAKGDTDVYRLWISHDAYAKGEIPDCIGYLTSLENISFEYSNIGGRLPKTIGNLTKLKRLTISNCRFEGEIPESINNCTQFEYVDMSNNHFTGEIPESFFQCDQLSYLMLHNNNFTKFTIEKNPISENLHSLFIEENEIQSPIPEKLFQCRGLRFFHAENNRIRGSIPNSIKDALNLEVVHLQNNNIDGQLPSGISNDSRLGNIDVRNNQISGTIPDCYSSMTRLIMFDVRDNYLDIENSNSIKNNPNYKDWHLTPQK